MSMSTIVKVQKPLSHPDAPLLIYSLDRTVWMQMRQDQAPQAVRDSLQAWPKQYWHVDVANHRLTFNKLAPAQAW